jgi:uncharacterized membrane protein
MAYPSVMLQSPRSHICESRAAFLPQLFSIPISIAAEAAFGSSRISFEAAISLSRTLNARSASALVLTGALAALLGQCYARCYKCASATAVTFAGNVNKIATIVLSVVFFGASRTTPIQGLGMFVCLLGAFAFSLLRVREVRATEDGKND